MRNAVSPLIFLIDASLFWQFRIELNNLATSCRGPFTSLEHAREDSNMPGRTFNT